MTEITNSSKATAFTQIRRYGLRVVVALLAFGALGFFVVPPLVKSVLVDKLAEVLHRPVTIEGVSINPYTLSAQVTGLSVHERGGGRRVLGFESLYVNLESSSVWRGGWVVSELKLLNPVLEVVRSSDGRLNFGDLIDEWMAQPSSDDPIPAFSISNVQISGGTVSFDDRKLDEKHLVSEMKIMLPFLSSLPHAVETFVEPAFAAVVDGSPLVLQGRSKPFSDSRESELSLDFHGVQLAKYVDYLPFSLPIRLVSGALDSDLTLAFQVQKDGRPLLGVSGKVALGDLQIHDSRDSPLLSVKRVDVSIASIEPFASRFVVDRVSVDSPEIHARVSRQGTINWLEYFSEKAEAAHKRIDARTSAGKEIPDSRWSVGEIVVSKGAVRWLDESHGAPFNASLDAIDVSLRKLDSAGSAPAEFDATWRLDGAQWIKVDKVAITGGRLDLANRVVSMEEFSSRSARMLIRRAGDGHLEFVPPPHLRMVAASQKDLRGVWKLTVAKYRGEDFGLRFEDAAVSPKATLLVDGWNIELDSLSTDPGNTTQLSTRFRLNRRGEVELRGRVRLSPLDGELKVAAKTVELLPLQPYFTESLNVDITRGLVTLGGTLNLQQTGAGPFTVENLHGGFVGQLSVGDFQAVDKVNSADFLKWKSLYVGHIDLHFKPNALSIGEVALADFFARVIVSRAGQLNLLHIVRRPEAVPSKLARRSPDKLADSAPTPVPVPASDKPAFPIKIAKITLQGGDIKFTDNFIKPNYSANLKRIGGTVRGLSSSADSVAAVELRGSYDNIAPVNIIGQFNPLAKTPYLDLQADVKGVELTSLSPYSGKYAGYAIEKGKLSLFVKYKIENNQLNAENRVFLDQLTFGEPVASPEATKLPVTLAVALLKNRNGEIDINLPIGGSLSDPEFSVGGLILKVIGNLLMKAVTSPFALLGSAFGSGEELSYVEFDAGQAALGTSSEQRLDKLARAVIDRPALKIEIQGHADPASDPEGIKRARLDRKIRAMKREELTRKAVEGGSAEVTVVDAKEYSGLLERVYRAEKFPKPRNLIGMTKGLPVEEMEKLILTNSVVDDEDLRELADGRAKTVRDWLIAHAVPDDRLFLLPVKLATPDGKADAGSTANGTRVVFSLK